MRKTTIGWCHYSWNTVWGCSKVSEGCDNCYAEALSLHWKQSPYPWENKYASENIRLMPHKLNEPYKVKEPSLVFANSMSDMFHPEIPFDYLDRVFEVMYNTPHTYQILTKRPKRSLEYAGKWTENIWLGTSVESRKVLHRIDTLRKSKASLKFLSVEPLLESLGEINLDGIEWVIVGGESGNNARPMDHEWAREVRDQCVVQDIPFYFKQSSHKKPNQGMLLAEPDGTFSSYKEIPRGWESATPVAKQPNLFDTIKTL